MIADIGTWSIEHPPATDYFVPTGVQYAMQPYLGGFLVTDGHHNRVLRVGLDGSIEQDDRLRQHRPDRTRHARSGGVHGGARTDPTRARGRQGRRLRSMVATRAVEIAVRGEDARRRRARRSGIYALSQGQWDGVAEGSPATPGTGQLVKVDGAAAVPVVDGAGDEMVLDRPTSLEIVGDTAYVVSLAGTVVEIDGL